MKEEGKIRPEIEQLTNKIKKAGAKRERIFQALEYNESIRQAWKPLWLRFFMKNVPNMFRIFKDRAADMAFIDRKDHEAYWELMQIPELNVLRDVRNHAALMSLGLTKDQLDIVIEKYPALETIEDEEIKKRIPSIRNFVQTVRKMTPALLLGSGPSLDKMAPHIKKWKGAIFCSSSQLDWCTYHGVRPSYVTIIDSDPNMRHLVDDFDSTDIPLLTHPCIDNYIVEHWKGPIYFFRMNDPGDPWFGDIMPIMTSVLNEEKNIGIRSYVLNSGCVANVNIAIAQFLGYFPIFLSGIGFDCGRFQNYKRVNGEWVAEPQPAPDSYYMMSRGNNGVLTHQVQIFYKFSMMVIYGLDCPQLISCADPRTEGILQELPYASPGEVVAKQGRGFEHLYRSREEMYKIAFTYLWPRGIYILKGPEMVSIQNRDSLDTFAKKMKFWKTYLRGWWKGWW